MVRNNFRVWVVEHVDEGEGGSLIYRYWPPEIFIRSCGSSRWRSIRKKQSMYFDFMEKKYFFFWKSTVRSLSCSTFFQAEFLFHIKTICFEKQNI